jgi:hypothetical protein
MLPVDVAMCLAARVTHDVVLREQALLEEVVVPLPDLLEPVDSEENKAANADDGNEDGRRNRQPKAQVLATVVAVRVAGA